VRLPSKKAEEIIEAVPAPVHHDLAISSVDNKSLNVPPL